MTTPLTDETEISPRRYLADTAAAADAVGEFTSALAGVGRVARPEALRRVAPELRPPLQRTRAIAGRLAAARLEDRRLEAQRGMASERLDRVVEAMERVTMAAALGDAAAAAAAASAFSNRVGELRELPEI